ncbi:MAG: putative replication initiation protein [Cressdnaviricota sp.]|nr:MAG: putative replication initiation protein [Cressdnaviricota sp.]
MDEIELAKYGQELLTSEQRLCIEELELVRKLAMRKALVSLYSQYYMNMIYEGKFDEIAPKLKLIRDELDLSKEIKATEWVFITINPKDTVSIKIIMNTMEKLVSKKWIQQYIYVLEQRSEGDEDIRGVHVHLLLNRNGKKPGAMKNEIKNTCVKICDVSNPHILNFKNLPTDKDVCQSYNYITGVKSDVEKHPKQAKDEYFRKYYNINPYYKSEFLDIPKLLSDIE